MEDRNLKPSLILGAALVLGMCGMAAILGGSLLRFKSFERTASVKGLAEKEFPADVAIWPVRFARAADDLAALYLALEKDSREVAGFLKEQGFHDSEITVSPPSIVDKFADRYGSGNRIDLRYTGSRTVTIYSAHPKAVRTALAGLIELGKKGVVIEGGDMGSPVQYIFTRLNEVKPAMVEEATTKAREVAEKFAQDSQSRLGKIRGAQQGQFSIEDRDPNTPYIKRVRVVVALEYYLPD